MAKKGSNPIEYKAKSSKYNLTTPDGSPSTLKLAMFLNNWSYIFKTEIWIGADN